MTHDSATAPIAAPKTTVAPGAPESAGEPSSSWPTIDATVDAAMCPVLPSAVLVNRAIRVRRRAASIATWSRPAASWAMNDIRAILAIGGRSGEEGRDGGLEGIGMPVDICLGRHGRHQGHVVERRHQHA